MATLACGSGWYCPEHGWICDLDDNHEGEHMCVHCPELRMQRRQAEKRREILEQSMIPSITDDPDV